MNDDSPKPPLIRFSLKEVGIALLWTLPGAALALLAKPLVLGEGALLMGLALAIGAPIVIFLYACLMGNDPG